MKTARTVLLVAVAMASTAVADVVVMKAGETIIGKVLRFEHGEHSLATSHFVVEVKGKEQSLPLFKIDTVTFGTDTPPPPKPSKPPKPSANSSPTSTVRPRLPLAGDTGGGIGSRNEVGGGGGYWLSTTGKRHNPSCRYYGSSKGRSCGASEGTACKVCGG